MTQNLNVNCEVEDTPLVLGDVRFKSRLFTGTGKFASASLLQQAILASESELVQWQSNVVI